MADYAFFYNSEDGDRKYDADSFSDWLKKFFTDGVFQGDLQVTAKSGMQVTVGGGYVNIGGKVRLFDVAEDVNIETANPTYNRIDNIVAERNDTERNITIKVVTGGYSSDPVAPDPVRANGVYQLVLAHVHVDAGTTAITQSMIEDTRTDVNLCGYVVTPIDNFDFGQFTTRANAYIDEFISTSQRDYETWSAASKESFDEWFANIRYILDGDVAGHLQNEIDALNTRVDNLKTGGSNIKVNYALDFVGMTATLTTEVGTYTQTVGTDGVVEFNGILEIGHMSIECDGRTIELDVEYYSWYEFSVGAYGFQQWLDTGRVTKTFNTLEEVLADEKTLRQLFTVHASTDYLVEWIENDTEVGQTILDNNYCAKWINLRDYALDTLYASASCKAIMDEVDKYGYGEWVLNADGTWGAKGNVPIMTSNTAPYGEVTASGNNDPHLPYRAFMGKSDTQADRVMWYKTNSTGNPWIMYKFTNPIKLKEFSYELSFDGSLYRPQKVEVLVSNDGSTFKSLGQFTTYDTKNNAENRFKAEADNYYLCVKVVYLEFYNNGTIITDKAQATKLQFYGRELSVSVPTMTSDTEPCGVAFAKSEERPAWNAFNNNGIASGGNQNDIPFYIGYRFINPKVITMVAVKPLIDHEGTHLKDFTVQGSNDNTTWSNLYSSTYNSNTTPLKTYSFSNNSEYKYYRLYCPNSGTRWICLDTLQFYGLDYSEREFAEDSKVKASYDHGVEITPILEFKVGSSIFEKRQSSIYIGADGNLGDPILSHLCIGEKVDLSKYKVIKAKLGKQCETNSSGNNFSTFAICTAQPFTISSGSAVGRTSVQAIAEKDSYYNVGSAISGEQYVEIYCGLWSGNKAHMYCEIEEIWFEEV